jgi:hypothetical protein
MARVKAAGDGAIHRGLAASFQFGNDLFRVARGERLAGAIHREVKLFKNDGANQRRVTVRFDHGAKKIASVAESQA